MAPRLPQHELACLCHIAAVCWRHACMCASPRPPSSPQEALSHPAPDSNPCATLRPLQVVTVPAHFNERQLGATRQAASLAGLPDRQVLLLQGEVQGPGPPGHALPRAAWLPCILALVLLSTPGPNRHTPTVHCWLQSLWRPHWRMASTGGPMGTQCWCWTWAAARMMSGASERGKGTALQSF